MVSPLSLFMFFERRQIQHTDRSFRNSKLPRYLWTTHLVRNAEKHRDADTLKAQRTVGHLISVFQRPGFLC